MNLYPLIVDLDGTLIETDMLHESTIGLLRNDLWRVCCIPSWLLKGKAYLKKSLASYHDFDPSLLPYNHDFISWLNEQRNKGRKLILCTASDSTIATAISNHLGIFDEVIASDGVVNLAGKNKAKILVERFGHQGFDYAGNSSADLSVWECARRAIVVNANTKLVRKVAPSCEVELEFPRASLSAVVWCRVLRMHQWLKNLLLFIPLFAAHQFLNVDVWPALITAFFSFSLCASSVYIANDLLDLESDRLHPRKRKRPFASGLVPVWVGVLLVPLLLLSSFYLALYVEGQFFSWLLFYFVLTCGYSFGLKRLMLIDCITLAILYTLRIVAGASAASMMLSFWLLAFSVFLFFSLAFVKRYAELELQLHNGKQKIHGRGYYPSDAGLIQTLGVTSGYAAVLVLALYLNSEAVVKLYKTPEFIWGVVPVMLFWISWMWMQAHRGKMHDDPLVFAVKDKASLLAGVAFFAVITLGSVGWPW